MTTNYFTVTARLLSKAISNQTKQRACRLIQPTTIIIGLYQCINYEVIVCMNVLTSVFAICSLSITLIGIATGSGVEGMVEGIPVLVEHGLETALVQRDST
jgi:hypothetical protein